MIEVPDASCHQARFTAGSAGDWRIVGAWEPGAYTLAEPPADGDRADAASFVAFHLRDDLGCGDLFSFNDANLADLARLADAFVVSRVPAAD
jgi:hypothetical protein